MLLITIFKVFNFEKFKKNLNIKIAIHFCLCYTLASKGVIMRNLTPMQIKNHSVSAFGCGYYFCIGANIIV